MADLSQPSAQVLAHPAEPFAWPLPSGGGYDQRPPTLPTCEIEGHNGKLLDGQLMLFAPERGVLQLGMPKPRRPLPLRLEQFRRLRLVEPLRPEASAPHPPREAAVPFRIEFHGAPPWQGMTVGCVEQPWGVFLFQPVDDQGTLRRWFVPRPAVVRVQVGTPAAAAVDAAAADDAAGTAAGQRQRALDGLVLVRRLATPDELHAAIEQQSRMPMVRIGEALLALGYITQPQLDEALARQRGGQKGPLGEVLVASGVVSRADLQTALARKMGYPLVDAALYPVDAQALARVPHAVAARVAALPLGLHAGRLVVALEDPSNRAAIDEIEFVAQCKVVPVLARAGVLPDVVDREYGKIGAVMPTGEFADPHGGIDYEPGDASKLLATMEREKSDGAPEAADDPGIEQSDNSLVRLINSMIVEAHAQGVSDIHVECPAGKDKVRIRFRRDGLLRPYLELPPSYRSALIARIKIMCDLDISERRKPQDGKINFSRFVQGVKLELRVATIPTNAGMEDAVLRLLQSSKPIPLDQLGLSGANLERLKTAVQRPYGMLLCVGPTGSGKTTTLHSAMGFINTPERKIWTAEDPVEITQAGLRQVQVNPRIEWTFAKALRAFLRADPDVIMVGEIRDNETAQVSVEASLTGHLVLSTLHTNSAPETVTRLLDMGMDPFNFADALLAVLAQRLVRKLCTQCRAPHVATPQQELELASDWLYAMQGIDDAPTPAEVVADWRRRFATAAASPAAGPVAASAAPSQPGEHGSFDSTETEAMPLDWQPDGAADLPGAQGTVRSATAVAAAANAGGGLVLYRPVGCEHCGHNGYRGRAGIHELMMVTRGLRHLVQTGARAEALQQQALGDGMRTLRQDGIEKVLAGLTTIDEVRANS